MRYLMLIYNDEGNKLDFTPEIMEAYHAYTAEVQEKELLQAGNALQSVTAATTVRVRNGKTVTTDGPFAETKEQLGGYYLLDCKDLDEAIEYAAKIPTARHGSVEVRPIMEFD